MSSSTYYKCHLIPGVCGRSLYMYIGGVMIISATIAVTVASHRRKSQQLGSVKRRLSFSSLPDEDVDDAGSVAGGTPRSAVHERTHALDLEV